VVIIGHGRLLADATLAELTSRVESTVRVRSPQAELLRSALVDAGIVAEAAGTDALAVRGASTETVGELAARAGVVLHELTTERTNLEQVFFELTQAGEADGAAPVPVDVQTGGPA
jgi:ABC-2 type transport system ATP-binding protein